MIDFLTALSGHRESNPDFHHGKVVCSLNTLPTFAAQVQLGGPAAVGGLSVLHHIAGPKEEA